MEYLTFENVSKYYKSGSVTVAANDGISFEVKKGEFCVICGPSGAGKSTLLNILGGMEKADSGKIVLDGKEISSYSKRKLAEYRRDDVGFVFQFYNLIQSLTALENIEMATDLCEKPLSAAATLEAVGLKDRMNYFPAKLSGGEQQRVAIARALAKNPKILLCDEPTGALDSETGKNILRLLYDSCKNMNKTVIVITHNSSIAEMADRVIRIKNGKVTDITENADPIPVERIEW